MAKTKRERQKARRNEARAYQSMADTRSRRQKAVVGTIVVLLVVALVGGMGLQVLTGDDAATTTSAPTSEPDVPDTTDTTPTTAPASPCPDAQVPPAKDVKLAPSPAEIDDTKKYTATMETSCGTMVFDLDPKSANRDVSNFVYLARQGFYDNTIFHRVISDFMVQGGDPTAPDEQRAGTGGPGYSYEGTRPKADSGAQVYHVGDLAMANSGGPETNGSQFFIVSGNGPSTVNLPGDYSLFGHLTQGEDVLGRIQATPVGGSSGTYPLKPVVITKVTVTEQ